jgi:hypothetical protein
MALAPLPFYSFRSLDYLALKRLVKERASRRESEFNIGRSCNHVNPKQQAEVRV